MERFKWTTYTCRAIDWEVFGWAYKQRIKKKFGWSNKYHLKRLPTGDRMKRRGELDDERCCSCGAPLETDDHLFQCPKRPQFQRRILAAINETKPKMAPFLYRILYDGVKRYICKYENRNDNDDIKSNNKSNEKHEMDEDVHDNNRTVKFKQVQSKFRITEDSDEETESEAERISADPDNKLKYIERIKIMQKETPNRKRKRLIADKIDKKRYLDRLDSMQTEISWDNLLRGKIAKEWRQYQREYEKSKTKERNDRNVKLKLKHGNVSNPYEKDKEKKEKKKQKSKDIFQHLIERIFVIAEEELWTQRNLDRRRPSNKSSYTEVIKVDREIRRQYGLYDEVRPADRDIFYSLDIEQRLSQTIHEKRKWIIRWRDTIRSSIKRNKIRAATDNPIWSYYDRKTEPEV